MVAKGIDEIHLDATSRDEQVRLELRGKYDVKVSIAPNHAERVGDAEVARQLGQAGRVLFAKRAAEIDRLARRTGALESRVAYAEVDEAFAADIERFSASASSTDGTVTMTTFGMKQFAVDVARGTAENYGGAHIAEAAAEALAHLVPEIVAEIRRLRRQHYGNDDQNR